MLVIVILQLQFILFQLFAKASLSFSFNIFDLILLRGFFSVYKNNLIVLVTIKVHLKQYDICVRNRFVIIHWKILSSTIALKFFSCQTFILKC